MARKKGKRKMSGVSRRKRAVSGVDTQSILGIVAGAVAAGYLNKVVPATVNDKLLAGGKVALGIALPMFIKSNRSLVGGIGAGMVAVGSVDLLKSFGALNGDFDIPVINGDVLAGDMDEMNGDLPVINADILSGDDDFLGFNEED